MQTDDKTLDDIDLKDELTKRKRRGKGCSEIAHGID